MPRSSTHRLRALIGPALAVLPVALAWAPAAPIATATSQTAKPVFDASMPERTGDKQDVALAGNDDRVVAALDPSDTKPTRIVELGAGKPPRPVRDYPRGASHPTLGTDAGGRPVVLVRACPERDAAGKGSACRIEVIDLDSGSAAPLAGGAGARIAAMDRGAVVMARGSRLTLTPAPSAAGKVGKPTPLAPLPVKRSDARPGAVTDLDLRGGVIAATVELRGEFGGSTLLRHDAGRGWTTIGLDTTGGGAIGPRTFSAPQVTATGVRAFFDGAEDLGGYAGRWGRRPAPVRKVAARRFGNPVHLTTAAFLGNRLLLLTWDSTCSPAQCRVSSFGPIPLG